MSDQPEPIDPRTLPLEPVECSLGTWTHSDVDDHGNVYLITRPDGQVWGIRAKGELSADNIENDIANPGTLPAAPIVRTPLQVLALLTPEEEAALTGSTDLAVAIVRNRLAAATEVRSDDPRTAEGAAILVAKGIITAERAAEIFPL